MELQTILDGITQELIDRIVKNLGTKNTVLVNTSYLMKDFDGFSDDHLNSELSKEDLASKITDFLAKLTQIIVMQRDVILITIGGETSYKCCAAIDSMQLHHVDEVLPAIALSIDHKAQWIVSKSGHIGSEHSLIDILNYFEKHKI